VFKLVKLEGNASGAVSEILEKVWMASACPPARTALT